MYFLISNHFNCVNDAFSTFLSTSVVSNVEKKHNTFKAIIILMHRTLKPKDFKVGGANSFTSFVITHN